MDILKRRVIRPDLSLTERIAVARALGGVGAEGFDPLLEAYKSFGKDPNFGPRALRSLVDCDRAKAEPIAREALLAKTPELKREALQILSETPQSALLLGEDFLSGKLDRAYLANVLAAVRRYPSPEHAKTLAAIDQALAKGLAKLTPSDVKDRLAQGSDPWNGLSVFLRENGSRCYTCHKIENFGGNVGPALTGVEQALSIDKLVEAVLEPSKEIKEGYESYRVALKDGRVLTGVKVSQDPNVLVLRDANAQETRISLEDIEEQAKDPVSLMPVGLLNDLSPQELADLIAFLRSKPAQGTLKTTQPVELVKAYGPLPRGKEEVLFSSGMMSALDRGKQREVGGKSVASTRLAANSAKLLNLRGQLDSTSSTAVLVVDLKSDKPQDAVLRYATEGESRVYLNGKKIAGSAPAKSFNAEAHAGTPATQ